MNATYEKKEKGTGVLTVILEPDELKPFLDRAAKKIAEETQIAGFRPGKAPYEVLEKQVGAMKIYQQAAEYAVEKTYPEAVVQHNLQTIGSPQVSVEKIAPGNQFVYTATVALLPHVKLGNYTKIKEEKKEIAASAEEVDKTINNLRRMFGKEKRVDRPAQHGDKVEIDMETFMDNVPLEGGQSQKQPVTIGEGHFIPGFEEQLVEMKAGEQKEFELHFPKEYHRKDLADKKATFKVKAHTVFEIEQPELNDDFAKQVGNFANLAALRSQIESNVKQEKTEKEQQRWELAVIDKVIEQSTFDEIPDMLIENELHRMMHELESDITKQGMKFDDYLQSINKTKDQLHEELKPRALKRVQTAIALRAIAEAENISVDDRELAAEVEKEVKQYEQNPEIVKQIRSAEYGDYLRNIMRSRKVFEFLANPKQK